MTLGLRATQARTDGDPSFRPRSQNFIAGQLTRRVDPTVAFSWKMAPELALFGRMQTGFRTGGLAVARMIGRVADFRPDAIALAELGIRRLRQGPTGLALTATLSQARWRDIQADLVTRRGLPYTANIGDARIGAVEGTADWVPIPGFNATLSFLYTGNRVRGHWPIRRCATIAVCPIRRRSPPAAAYATNGLRARRTGWEWRP
ncbi:Outer membrane cobalamin receptor protein [Sphingomonas paucimobilis]|nr:Outer membrane cobalamin receptor protein [Sphingomonas paucimobilis]